MNKHHDKIYSSLKVDTAVKMLGVKNVNEKV